MPELYVIGLFTDFSSKCKINYVKRSQPLAEQVSAYEKKIIEEALSFYKGKVNFVAEHLNIPRKKLYLRIRKYGINKNLYKDESIF